MKETNCQLTKSNLGNCRSQGGYLCGVLFVFLAINGCQCSDGEVLARAEEVSGSVERDFAASQMQWIETSAGAEFRVGDGIQSKAGGGAVLALGDDTYARLAEKSRIRFFSLTQKSDKNGRKFEVETGEVELTVGKSEFSLVTGIGTAQIAPGSRIRIRRTDSGTDFSVDIGKAVFFDNSSRRIPVSAGQKIDLEIGAAVIQDNGADTDKETDTAVEVDSEISTSDSNLEKESARSGARAQSGREPAPIPQFPEEPGTPDFAVSAGESFTVHAVSPPVTVAFDVQNRCDNEAAVQVGNRWISKGSDAVKATLSAGKHRYRIFCLDASGAPADREIAGGRVSVKRDAGRKRLPKAAPSSAVDTDGRRYKILYQTKLPSVTVRWPEAPAGQKYTLHITSGDKRRKISVTKPEVRLASGELGEGLHRLKFEAHGKYSRTSRTIEVSISYDNAAPTAGIVSPTDGGFSPGESVAVQGEAAPGWTVSVGNQAATLDSQRRFNETVVFQGAYRALSVRLAQPKRGIHYYLRRGRTP